jgi:hypothetical protein
MVWNGDFPSPLQAAHASAMTEIHASSFMTSL